MTDDEKKDLLRNIHRLADEVKRSTAEFRAQRLRAEEQWRERHAIFEEYLEDFRRRQENRGAEPPPGR